MSENNDKDIMDTESNNNILLSWDNLLETQTEILLPFELRYFFGSDNFTQANKLLEVGCGNGYYLSELRKFFKEKEFTGIDISSELIQLAKESSPKYPIQFIESDFFEFDTSEQFDLILMRLTVQHMKTLEDIFSKASGLLKEAGTLIILEPEPKGLVNIPSTPKFEELLEHINISSEKLNKNRSKLDQLDDILCDIDGWELNEVELYLVPHIGPFHNSKLLQMFLLWIDIIENAKAFQFDFDKVRSELEEWGKLDVAYSQLGMKIYSLKKVR